MTFLEFVMRKLYGPPSNGKWLCPFHEESNPSFNLLPEKKGYKDRFRCHSCGAWGDVADLLKNEYADEDYGERLERIAELRKEYDAANRQPGSIRRGRGEPSTPQASTRRDDPQSVDQAWTDLLYRLQGRGISGEIALCLLEDVAQVCATNAVRIESLLEYWSQSVA